MAQLVEHILGKDEVTGSTPVSSSISPQETADFYFFYKLIKSIKYGIMFL